MSFRSKLLRSFLILITITFTFLALFIQYTISLNNREYTEQSTLRLIEAKASETGNWFFNLISEFRVLSQLPSFKSVDFRGIDPMMESMTSFYKEDNDVHLLGFVGTNGKSSNTTDNEFENISHADFNTLLNTKTEYIINPPSSANILENMYTVYYPVHGYDGNVSGLLYGGITSGAISQMLSEITLNDSVTWIVDKQFNVVSHNTDYFYNSVLDKDTLVSSLSSSGLDNGVINLKNIEGQKSTMVYSNIPFTDLTLCSIIDDRTIHSHTTYITAMIFAIWVVLTTTLILFIFKLSKEIAKPLNELTGKMDSFKHEDFTNISIDTDITDIKALERSYNSLLDRIKTLIDEIYLEQSNVRNAELMALQSQVNPHFLYNSLDTIKWMAFEYQDDAIYTLIENLSSFFKISLSDGRDMISLLEELEHTKNYLEIQKIRFAETLDFSFDISDDIKNVRTLKVIVQPLVENSLYHGIKGISRKCHIKIEAKRDGDRVVIKVTDDGVGMSDERLMTIKNNLATRKKSDSYGLYNINERLFVKYNNDYNFDIRSTENEGTEIEISFAFEEMEDSRV